MKITTLRIRRPFHPVSLIPVFCYPAFKWMLAIFLLCTAMEVQAQTGTKIQTAAELSVSNDPSQGTSTSTGTTLFCKELSGFKLTSSTTDPTVTTGTPVSYTSWSWKEIDENGDPVALPTTATPTNEVLTVTSATPGWHTYQVIASTGASECPADAVIFTVYVLPDLTITSAVDPSNSPELKYCAANGAPTGAKAINLKSTVAFATTPRKVKGLRDLTLNDFELTYSWSKEEIGVAGSKKEVGTDADYTITEPAVSTTGGADRKFTYSVKVTYAAKACGDYVATTQSGSNPAVIIVTPKPGQPVITIQ